MLRFIKLLINNLKKIKHSFDKNVIFSIGENCLADNILERNNLKSFSSPYSSSRSNIEYILAFEQEKFRDFLNPNYLKYDFILGKKVVINQKYVKTENIYNNSVINGFEFTHHDVYKAIQKHIIYKRTERQLLLKNKNIIMLYHHRISPATNLNLLISHLQNLAEIYKSRKNNVNIFLFTQEICKNEQSRGVKKYNRGDIHFYNFFTKESWEGANEKVFWAYTDDDLLKEMVNDIRKKLI